MKHYFLFLIFSLFAGHLLAQTTQTYLNEAGETHLAGKFQLDILRTDTTYQTWFEENAAVFELSGKNTDWKKAFENSEVEIFLGTWCGDS
ncbi:hypothetical protein [uncultured Algoriphagus sp.]|uniref:hypothetical protein n=1 Tax=uncultured Algoriphagus sp. TaxID=417365 RepID=UPI0030EC98AA|tara:strand:+ start:3764 stop:4033 length:270 start_codon:yes stop_codon:yes gene_type:complete